jgi:hypothetical protein
MVDIAHLFVDGLLENTISINDHAFEIGILLLIFLWLVKEFPEISEKLALRCSKYFFDHSKVRFTKNGY